MFVGRNLRPIELGSDTELTIQPQLLIQRAIDGKSDGVGNLLGLEAQLLGRYGDYRLKANADISTFHPSNFINGSRYWGNFGRNLNIGELGLLKTELFGTYRYGSWNGSLRRNRYRRAYGCMGSSAVSGCRVSQVIAIWYVVLSAITTRSASPATECCGPGESVRISTSRFPLVWRDSGAQPPGGVSLHTKVIVRDHAQHQHQQLARCLRNWGLSEVPEFQWRTLTLGTFSKPFMDFTQFTVIGGGTLLGGASPFEFDRVVDFGTLGLGITWQIAGPLVIGTVKLNVDRDRSITAM